MWNRLTGLAVGQSFESDEEIVSASVAPSGESFAVAGDPPTVATLLAALRARGGAWSEELAGGRAVRVAVNHELAPAATVLAHDDEVALLPPVTGG